MIDLADVPPVGDSERLARYIFFSKHIRSSDGSVKPDAFVPHPYSEMSVTRHLSASDAELWAEGERIARLRKKTFYGRADFSGAAAIGQGLALVAAPFTENPNHANVTNWPAEKSEQKMKAIEIAAVATFLQNPHPTSAP